MKANEAIAVGVHELNDRVRRLHCDHAPTSSCGWCKDRREAAKTLAALSVFVEAALALAEHRAKRDYTLYGREVHGRFIDGLDDAYTALGLDSAPHGGAPSDKA